MAPSLQLFPSPSSSLPPRRSSLKHWRAKLDKRSSVEEIATIELQAVAVRIPAPSSNQPRVLPAVDTVQHTLFCDPSTTTQLSPRCGPSSAGDSETSSRKSPIRNPRTRRRSALIESHGGPSIPVEDDDVAPLPVNTNFGAASPSRSRSSLKRPRVPHHLANVGQPVRGRSPVSPIDESDQLSPLPTKASFHHTMVDPPEYPASTSSRSASPAFVGLSSRPKSTPQSPSYTMPIQSIFPQYDHSRPVNQQDYFPTARAPSPAAFTNSNVCRIASPIQADVLKHHDSAIGLFDGHEHVPLADKHDVDALWKASCGDFHCPSRKAQYTLSTGHGMALSIGGSSGDVVYSMDKTTVFSRESPSLKQLYVKKHCPAAPSSSLVAQLVLPDRAAVHNSGPAGTPVFPQQAAIDAIEAVANSPQACAIATFDPTAESPQAAMLAKDAVTEAYRRYECSLHRLTRRRDSLGTVIATYSLRHPSLGACTITVTKSQLPTSTTGPRAKISFHHPSATPAAVAADTLNLAFLDFAHDACVLDLPSLVALEGKYVVDTILGALLAVAAIENEALVPATEMMTFAPPPRAPAKPERRTSKSGRMFGGKGGKKGKGKGSDMGVVEEQVELPTALKVVDLSLRTAVWVLGTGVKVGASLLGGVGRVVRKL